MFQKIKNLLKKHKNNFLVRILFKIKQKFSNFKLKIENKKSIKRLKILSKIKPIQNRKIRVIFVVVNSNTWNKLKSLYHEMLNNDKIDVKIVCCPEPYKEDTSITYNYFKNNGYDCIDARVGEGPWNALENKGKWFNLKNLEPDYVFYSEPYNMYLPKKYKSSEVSKYAKICNVMYAMTTTREFLEIRPSDFYRDVYCCYANNQDELNYNINQFREQHNIGIQKTKYLGFLAFSDIYECKNKQSESWNFSKNKIRAIWTPRWTTDKTVGGSNFFKYKDILIKYTKNNEDVDMLFRPHPMALDNFVRTGEMSQDEVDQFKSICEITPNLSLDKEKSYTTTFWNSSFLITDISSIIVEYFVTGKPIIFCESSVTRQKHLPFFEKLINTCYVVKNENELINTINMLKKGQDKNKKIREDLIVELFGKDITSAPQNIVNDIFMDSGIL